MSQNETTEITAESAAADCHCGPGCTDACCRPPVVRDAAWHAAARRAKLLSWLSLGYMAAEGMIAVTATVLAGSVALLGFGLDSVIEGLASVIIVWRFSGTRTLSETAEARAQKAVAVTFFLLAPYIAYDAISTLASGEKPSTSWLGIGLSVASLIVMPLLGQAKRRLGKVLDSGATSGEGTQNLLCAYLAAAVLVGLLANTLFGLWWLDPVVGLLVAALAVREGMEAWRGEECGC
ncbi:MULTISPECIES: cation diffusion facilitator family transporter [Streptomycetaceae]|nr:MULTISPECIES: cation transporter [Streptomycetaceae]CCB75438.1 putative conserved integral membrane protein [Streptantibioticus cattleyicolor NRRL 8057 = DSM 46488]